MTTFFQIILPEFPTVFKIAAGIILTLGLLITMFYYGIDLIKEYKEEDLDESDDVEIIIEDIEIPVRYRGTENSVLDELDYWSAGDYDDGLTLDELKNSYKEKDYKAHYLQKRTEKQSIEEARSLIVSGELYEHLNRIYRYYLSESEVGFGVWCENVLSYHIKEHGKLFEGILKSNQQHLKIV